MARMRIPKRPWRRAALGFSVASFVTFLINLSFTIWASSRNGGVVRMGIGLLSEQSCDKTKTINTFLHILINIISAILLAGSNYCMQCLMAPTRSQIDAAHERRRWLDIGVPSFHNFFSISAKHKVVWILLGLSSLPLHLLYNSAIIASTSVNQYWIVLLEERIAIDRHYDSISDPKALSEVKQILDMVDDGTLSNITLHDLFDQYGRPFQSSRGTLVFVIPNDFEYTVDFWQTRNPPAFDTKTWGGSMSNDWMCDSPGRRTCNGYINEMRQNPQQWRHIMGLESKDIKRIYSQTTEASCKLLYSLQLCWIVTVLNLVKALLMLYVAFGNFDEPLLTIGDAVVSFLRKPDAWTESMCLKQRDKFSNHTGLWDTSPEPFKPKPIRKFRAVRWGRWVVSLLLISTSLFACIGLLSMGMQTLGYWMQREPTLREFGFGVPHRETLMLVTLGSGLKALLTSVLFANVPQVVLSLAYVSYNAILTSLSAASEWNSYGIHRKGLRVSFEPQGAQRETYFLQLPYRLSVPLLVFSGALHWLISQSIFVVALGDRKFKEDDKFSVASEEYVSYVTCGWSPLGLLCSFIVGFFMLLVLLTMAFARLPPSGIPMTSSRSAVISAACHNYHEKLAWERPVKWGAVESEGEIGHCSFSSEEVEPPQAGRLYA